MQKISNKKYSKFKIERKLLWMFLDAGRELDKIIMNESLKLILERSKIDLDFRNAWENRESRFVYYKDENGKPIGRFGELIMYYSSIVINKLTNNPLFFAFLEAWDNDDIAI
jgi:hypothetical protein